jgi:hypothetical protein
MTMSYIAGILDSKAKFHIIFVRKKQFTCDIQVHASEKNGLLKILKELVPYSTIYMLRASGSYRWRSNVTKGTLQFYKQLAEHLRLQKHKLNALINVIEAENFETKLRIYDQWK